MSMQESATLDGKDEAVFNEASKVAQVFSGIFFLGLAAWLLFANATKLAFVQRAALEKRLTVACFISTYIAFFSCFFNFFQLTDVDNSVLAYQSGYTLDLCRPIEWMCTCPLMQLELVLIGGAKIPEWRRYFMPLTAEFVLGIGLMSTLASNLPLRLVCYVVSCAAFGVLLYFNRKQILEHSSDEEGLFSGDSEYRKATLLLIATWTPFPIWYAISPEGLNLIRNITVIQVGWAFFNIIAKFTFIFYIQRVKDLYCNRLKTKREFIGTKGTVGALGRQGTTSPLPLDFAENWSPDDNPAEAYAIAETERNKQGLSAIVVETMSFLGMAQHTDRFLNLLEDAGITQMGMLEELDKQKCQDLSIPYDLVVAVQRRIRVWKLEMQDDAEAELDKGEVRYMKAKSERLAAGVPGYVADEVAQLGSPKMTGIITTGGDIIRQVRRSSPSLSQGKTSELAELSEQDMNRATWEMAAESMGKFQAELAAMERRLIQNLEATTKTVEQRAEIRAMENRLNQRLGQVEQRLDSKVVHVERKVDNCYSAMQHVQQEDTKVHIDDVKAHLLQKMDEVAQQNQLGMAKASDQTQAGVGKICHMLDEAVGHTKVGTAKVVLKLEEATDQTHASLARVLQRLEDAAAERGDRASKLAQKFDEALEPFKTGTARLAHKLEEVNDHMKAGLELAAQRVEGLQAVQVRYAAESDAGLKQRFHELESTLAHMDAELVTKLETSSTRRHEEAMRHTCSRRLDEFSGEFKRVAERAEAAAEALGEGLKSEMQVMASRLTTKAEGLQASALRQQAEVESSLQHRIEEAVAQAVAQGANQAVVQVSQRAEKAMEALESTQRVELAAAMTRLAQRVDVLQAAQQRQQQEADSDSRRRLDELLGQMNKRDEQASRKLEELMEHTVTRSEQAIEDVGNGMKKELHTFAKRLNNKFPFM